MTRIIICRHANTFDKGDIITRVGARTDMPLSSSGLRQAEVLAKELSPTQSDFNFKRAYCSSLQRTRQTAASILSGGHKTKEITALPFLTEIDYGADENKPEKDVVGRLGQEAIDLWNSKAIPPDGWNVSPGEIIKSWRQFFSDMRSLDGDILLVSSNGITRFALDAADKVVTNAPRKLRTAAFGVVNLKPNETDITAWDQRSLS